jgi:hypothetical protein
MFSRLMETMFGCWHSHYSFPMTVRPGSRRNQTAARLGTYVVCLDCGKELAYDWQQMRVTNARPRETSRSLVTKEAA